VNDSPQLTVDVVEGHSAVGGGAAPTTDVPTFLVSLVVPGVSADRLAGALRAGDPPVVARILEDRVVLDLRTVPPEEEAALRKVVAAATAGAGHAGGGVPERLER
jgi:L-seryl-tRNA(Ser) seleniumtransferase